MKFHSAYGVYALVFIGALLLWMAVFLLLRLIRAASRRQMKGSLLSVTLKLLVLGTLLVALCGPYFEKTEEKFEIFLLLDISDSLDEAVGEMLLAKARAFKGPSDKLFIQPFANSIAGFPIEDEGLLTYGRLKQAWGKLDIGATNIESALSRVRSREGRSIVLISDAHETKGNVRNVLKDFVATNSKVFPLMPVDDTSSQATLAITNLHVPLIAPAAKSVDVRISLKNSTNAPQSGILEVTHDGKSILEQTVEVPPQRELLLLAASDPSKEGIKEIKALLKPNGGISPSTRVTYLSGEQREKVLLLSGEREDARFLEEVLTRQAYRLDSFVSGGRLERVLDFSGYSVVIINNIPRKDLPSGSLEQLYKYVKEGGSFVMIGGAKSFGLGGYKDTLVEEMLPVELFPPQTIEKRLNVALEMVIDKSQSMGAGNKLDYAKEAAKEVIRNLKDEDFIGVIGFDSSPFEVVEMGRLADIRDWAMERVNLLYPNNQTRLFPAMHEGRRRLEGIEAGRKHMIILTDGRLPDGGQHYVELVRQMRFLGVTVSTVLLGGESDFGLLRSMAEAGGGAFYQTDDARSLPKIFLQDVKVRSGEKTLKEDQEYIVRKSSAEIVSTTLESFPAVRGYVQTKEKPRARLELVATGQGKTEPLLASWSFEKGKTLAFTSDVSGRWSKAWVNWGRLERFWTEVLDSLRSSSDLNDRSIKFDLGYSLEGGDLILDVAVYSDDVGENLVANVLTPDGIQKEVIFDAVSRGHFKSSFKEPVAGKYEFSGILGARKLTPVAFSLAGELFGEKRGEGFDAALLESIASITGGKVNPAREEIVEESSKARTEMDLRYIFLAIALLILLGEILWREVLGSRLFGRQFKRVSLSSGSSRV